eukprot:m.143210 g.143210  ORF g.143210 m.143210 type:complete len:1195 (+) comp16736_c0_seq1:55-3639(+)
MHLYSLTLQKASQITHAVHGNFSGTKQQLILLARGKVLEIVRPDQAIGRVVPLLAVETFGIIRSLATVRLTGSPKDYIVVGSDSGRLTILEYNADKNSLDRVHMETFGKSGCRRIVPGQHLGVDPKGRALMIGAVEKQKLVYILNRDSAARLTISSPLEAHKSHTFVFDTVGLDVGYENPVFASLELNYEEADDVDEDTVVSQQTLTFYELDLGLNHVVRKESIPLDDRANCLIPVPGGNDGPGGVLVCFDGFITWRTFGPHKPVTVRIPKRRAANQDPNRGVLITASAMHKTKAMFFFLLQTEYGDIFKLTVHYDKEEVKVLVLKYFDTTTTANAMCLLKNGLLFIPAEFGNHYLYQISHLGDNEDEPEFTSMSDLEEVTVFQPRGLRNLTQLEVVDSLAPILACQAAKLGDDDTPQLVIASGQGARASIKTLRHGLEVAEMAVSELPGVPTAVWTVRKHVTDAYDAYIVVSFLNATIVLGIGETVEEVSDSGFVNTVPTLYAGRIGDNAAIQVHASGIRHIRADKRVSEWTAPNGRYITHCAVNEKQVAIALDRTEIVYFELDRAGQLIELSDRMTMPSEVACMAVGPIAFGLQRCAHLAVGCMDNTVRIASLDPVDCLQPKSMQALPETPESLCIAELSAKAGEAGTLYLNIGLSNGVLLRTLLDPISGELSDTRTRYLGARPARLHRITMQGMSAVIALSARPWLSYSYQGHSRLTPLSYDPLEGAASFSSEQCPEGIVAISRNTMRILAINRLGTIFNQKVTSVQYTPRKIAVLPSESLVLVAEGDHNVAREAGDEDGDINMEGGDADSLPAAEFGATKTGKNTWASNIRVLDPVQNETLALVRLAQNEMATCIARVEFRAAQIPDAAPVVHVVVGVVKDWDLSKAENNFSEASLHVYQMHVEDRTVSLQFLHKTVVDKIPAAVCAFQGRVLAGVGKLLRLYDLGKKKLLKKCENRRIPECVVNIISTGVRICVSDVRESIHLLKYRAHDNQLILFADDTIPRWITATCFLDYSTVAMSDKFGNIFVARLPKDATDDVDDDPSGVKAIWDKGLLNGASQKVEVVISYYVGETVLSLQRVVLNPGGPETLMYTTMAGGVGCLMPFTTREDVDFFQHLEMHMRAENAPLCGRDHLSFRSSYVPSKNVVDGDLCEQYNSLDIRKKRSIAEELDRSAGDVSKKLEDLRNRYAF